MSNSDSVVSSSGMTKVAICLAIALGLQAFGATMCGWGGEDNVTAGIVVIVIASIFMFCIPGIAENQQSIPVHICDGEVKWRQTDKDQIIQLLDVLVSDKPVVAKILEFFTHGFFMVVWGIAAFVALVNEQFALSVIFIDIFPLMRILVNLMTVYADAPTLSRIRSVHKSLFHILENGSNYAPSLEIVPELQLQADKYTGQPVIQDEIRCSLTHRDPSLKPEALLCSMFSFTLTTVRETRYAYVYFVMVLKCSKLKRHANKVEATCDRLARQDVEKGTSGELTLETKREDGNLILVCRKSDYARKSYSTSFEDLNNLLKIAEQLMTDPDIR